MGGFVGCSRPTIPQRYPRLAQPIEVAAAPPPWALNSSSDRLPRARHPGMMSTKQSSSLSDGGAHYGEPAEDSDYPCP